MSVDVRNIFQIDDKGTMGLKKKWWWQYGQKMIKRQRQEQSICFSMKDRFFLKTFNEKDIFQREVVNTFRGDDVAVSRLGLRPAVGKLVHGRLLFDYMGL